jgi:drug/metabolite transporter (DMT)-like permease
MSKSAWGAFLGLSVLWGIPYLFIKLAVGDGVPPAFVAWARVAVAAAVLVPLAWRRGALAGLRTRIGPLVAFSVAELAVPFPMIALGERYVSSSVAAILIAAVPLTIALLALRFDPGERVGGLSLIGLFVGLAGVAALVGIDLSGDIHELFGAACLMVATLGYSAGALIVKRRLADIQPLGPVAAAMGLAALILAPAAAISMPGGAPSPLALGSIGILGVACSAIAFLLCFALIADVGAGRASLVTYINPVIAVALGVPLLSEHIGAATGVGVVLILAGSWLASGGAVKRRDEQRHRGGRVMPTVSGPVGYRRRDERGAPGARRGAHPRELIYGGESSRRAGTRAAVLLGRHLAQRLRA